MQVALFWKGYILLAYFDTTNMYIYCMYICKSNNVIVCLGYPYYGGYYGGYHGFHGHYW